MRVLYLEDNPVDADLALRALRSNAPNDAVAIAPTLARARDYLNRPEDFELILADLKLPDGSGIELLNEIRARALPLAVVILTGSGDQGAAISALKAGADDYLIKRGDYLERLPQIMASALMRFRAAAARKAHPLRVLYVEHNAFDIDLTRRHFALYAPHLHLDVVGNAAEALKRLPIAIEDPSTYDVLLLDYRLPEMDALDLTKIVRQERGLDIAIVLVTGQGSEEVASQALHLGISDYVIKHPSYLFELPATLEKAHHEVELARERLALKASNSRYDELAAHIPVGVYRLRIPQSGGRVFEYVSPRLCQILELENTDLLDNAELFFDRVHQDDAAEFNRLKEQARFGREHFVFESRFNIDGQTRWLLVESIPTLLSNGDVIKSGVVMDVTERLQAEAQLQLQSSALEAAANAIVITDANALVEWANPAFSDLTGYTLEEAVGMNPKNLLNSGLHSQAFFDNMWQTILSGEVWRGEIINRRKDLSLYHEDMTITPVLDDKRNIRHFIAVKQDISERKQIQFVQLTRNAVLDQIISNQSLPEILNGVAKRLESIRLEMRVSILLKEPGSDSITVSAAPSLPAFFDPTIKWRDAVIERDFCEITARKGQPVIVEDLSSHAFWKNHPQIITRAGIRACWFHPFEDDTGKMLGILGVYFTEPKSPSAPDLELIAEFARITALAVQKVRAKEALHQAAIVFKCTRDGVIITNADTQILAVNPAYCQITGYSEEEMLGKKPNILRSGRHDHAFYQALWASLNRHGYWQGEIWNRSKCGEIYPEWSTINAVRGDKGEITHYIGVTTDLSQLKRSEADLEHLAHYDPLTNLPNRLLFQSRLEHALHGAPQHGRRLAVLMLDLDRFKDVNDSLGHPSGDALLLLAAERVRRRLHEDNTMARLGGDEFALLLEHLSDPQEAAELAQDVMQLLTMPFSLDGGREVCLSGSIGISLFPNDGGTVTELLRNADAALNQAKENGRNQACFYTGNMNADTLARLELENALRNALDRKELLLHYQPKVDLRTGQICGAEALLRWRRENMGLVSPLQFIPAAERTGLIIPIGTWVIDEACRQIRAWKDQGLTCPPISVNVSARQFFTGELESIVSQTMAKYAIGPNCLDLEVTESTLMKDPRETTLQLKNLKAAGVTLSLDDFGTGYSSLAYLSRFPIDTLKIDQSFVRGILTEHTSAVIAVSIIALAHRMGLKVVAEGVETVEQLDYLNTNHCDEMQGYYFSRPIPADGFASLLRSGKTLHHPAKSEA